MKDFVQGGTTIIPITAAKRQFTLPHYCALKGKGAGLRMSGIVAVYPYFYKITLMILRHTDEQTISLPYKSCRFKFLAILPDLNPFRLPLFSQFR